MPSNYIYSNGQLYNTDELMHYGVPGMRWGHRKAKMQQIRANRKQRKKLEKEYGKLEDQLTYGKKANVKKNAEISKKLNNIEKKLNSLNKKDRDKKVKKGRSKVAGLLAGTIAGVGTSRLGFGAGVSGAAAVVAQQNAKSRMKMYDELYKNYR